MYYFMSNKKQKQKIKIDLINNFYKFFNELKFRKYINIE